MNMRQEKSRHIIVNFYFILFHFILFLISVELASPNCKCVTPKRKPPRTFHPQQVDTEADQGIVCRNTPKSCQPPLPSPSSGPPPVQTPSVTNRPHQCAACKEISFSSNNHNAWACAPTTSNRPRHALPKTLLLSSPAPAANCRSNWIFQRRGSVVCTTNSP